MPSHTHTHTHTHTFTFPNNGALRMEIIIKQMIRLSHRMVIGKWMLWKVLLFILFGRGRSGEGGGEGEAAGKVSESPTRWR